MGEAGWTNLFCKTACTSPDNAGQMMSLHVDGARSGLDRERMAPGSKAACTIAVPTRTLDSILEEAQAPSTTIRSSCCPARTRRCSAGRWCR